VERAVDDGTAMRDPGSASNAEYDLTSPQQATQRWRLFVRIYLTAAGLGLVAIVGAVVIHQFEIRDWVVAGSISIGFPIAFFLLWIGNMRYRQGPRAMSIDSEGLTLTYDDGSSQRLIWSDSRLRFKLIDSRVAYLGGPTESKSGSLALVGPKSRISAITPEAYEAILSAARAHGLRMDRRLAGRGAEQRAIITVSAATHSTQLR
jgi:hypothetical protein